jgi:4-hydroxy-tetrahydrodipicolinate reductase
MKFGLLGSSGKMGKAIIAVAVKMGIDLIYHSRSVSNIIKDEVFESSDVIIDFSSHEALEENLSLANKYVKPILIGTTGHNEAVLMNMPTNIPVLYAPNTCAEWAILKRAIKNIIHNEANFLMTIDDIHASTKKDSPSGTAKDLIKSTNAQEVRSIRKVNLASWHKVSLFDTDQIIHIEHQVLNREVYASGAIKLAMKLTNLVPGWYLVEDILDINL